MKVLGGEILTVRCYDFPTEVRYFKKQRSEPLARLNDIRAEHDAQVFSPTASTTEAPFTRALLPPTLSGHFADTVYV